MAAVKKKLQRVTYLDQHTVSTKSDHEALFVCVRIANRRRTKTTKVWMVSVNLGGKFDQDDLFKLMDHAKSLNDPVIFHFQEGGDQLWIRHVVKRYGYVWLSGSQPGMASTPMAVSRKIKIKGFQWRNLLHNINGGAGAGPAQLKDKWFRKTRFVLGGVRFGSSSIHAPASQHKRLRWEATLIFGRKMVHILKQTVYPMFGVGDINSDNDQRFVEYLNQNGVTTNHRELDEINTHENRSIDAVCVAERWVA